MMAERILKAEIQNARVLFRETVKRGLAIGDFEDLAWNYRGRKLLFYMHGKSASSDPLDDASEALAKCFVARCMTGPAPSKEAVYSKLLSFRALATALHETKGDWTSLRRRDLDRAQSYFDGFSEATRYHRANALAAGVDFINMLAHRVDGKVRPFATRVLRWSHGITNPTHKNIDVTTREHEERRDRLYKPGIEVALGKARFAARERQANDLDQGYDLIRLESLAFALGLGLRIGEITALPVNALELDADNGTYFLRVPTEKNGEVRAVGVPDLWVPAFKEAYTYLLERCAAARNRARNIEAEGFSFVHRCLSEVRKRRPQTQGRINQLTAVGLDPAKYFLIAECVEALQASPKEFAQGGRYQHCQVALPRLVASNIALWLDERLARWDWNKFAVMRHSELRLPLEAVATYAGSSPASASKATWFAPALREFLADLKTEGCLKPNHAPIPELKRSFRTRWRKLRRVMLEKRGQGAGVSCVAIDEGKFIETLAKRYSESLTRHFDEFFDPEDIIAGRLGGASSVRTGAPSTLSEHLIVIWENEFSGRKGRGILPRAVYRSDYYNYLSKNNAKRTCFERFGITDHQGKPFSFSPHAIRRWLTTALLRAGVSEIACDIWMGRDIGQTRHYDYRTAAERAEQARTRYVAGQEPNDFLGRKVKFWRAEGMSENEIKSLIREKLKVLHYTPWGACSKELYVSPCQRGLMCLRGFDGDGICPSFHLDPSDQTAKRAIEDLRSKYQSQLRIIGHELETSTEAIVGELNTSEPIDQHINYMIEVVQGCEEALRAYENNNDGKRSS